MTIFAVPSLQPTLGMSTDEKPSRNENEYFARQDAEAIRAMREQLNAQRAQAERQTLHCPRCGVDLVEQETDHVMIDVCPQCSGIWLDSGELEQLRRVNHERGAGGGVLGSLFRRG
jgi:hypothetical protein